MIDITFFLNRLISIGAIIGFAIIAHWTILILSHRWVRFANNTLRVFRGDDPRIGTLSTLIRFAGGVGIFFVAGSMILKELSIDITPLLTGAGILGLIITFSLQTLLKDVVAGVFILFESQYSPGTQVTLNDISGVVERLSLRSTVLKDADGNHVYIPNGSIGVVRVISKKNREN
ncbi:mechanosensitive ion channel [Candidatus Uhrbacteria bacterium]|nr:mechanosensitive ion channel [Candidatus Uhrbacteria bacterium]